MNIISVEWKQKGPGKEGGWEAAFPGVEGFEGPSRRTWVCVGSGMGMGRGQRRLRPSARQVHHLTFTWLWVANKRSLGKG